MEASNIRNGLVIATAVALATTLGCIDERAPVSQLNLEQDGGSLGPGEGDERRPPGDPEADDTEGSVVSDSWTEGGQDCAPTNCEALGFAAGLWEDGCGGVLDCGDWLELEGGSFAMGDKDTLGSAPEHHVDVSPFAMWRTEVTVEEYATCVDAGWCDPPAAVSDDELCVWGDGGDDQRPVNCVTWHQAGRFCEFAGGRLSSEAEWEFAARSEGEDVRYPWGDDAPTCSRAVMVESGVGGCGMGAAWPVCSRPDGSTASGLCDLAGNLIEWVEDDRHMGNENSGGYDVDGDGVSDAPDDGSAWLDSPRGLYRMQRGGSYQSTAVDLSNRYRRAYNTPAHWAPRLGFRCARDVS